MDIKVVRTFVTLSETLNYQKASERLSYATSTLNDHIRALEQELGVKLFFKVGRQLELTEEGKSFKEHAQRLLDDYDRAVQSVAKTRQKLALKVSCNAVSANFNEETPLASFMQRNPTICLRTYLSANTQIPQMLRSGDVDVGIYYSLAKNVPQGLDGAFLCRVRLCVIAPKDHPLAKRRGLRYADLAGQDFITAHDDNYSITWILKQMADIGVKPGEVYSFGGLVQAMFKQMREQNTLIGCTYPIALSLCDDGNFQILDLAEEPIWVWAGVFYAPTKRMQPEIAAFMRNARSFYRELLQRDQSENAYIMEP